VVGKLSGILWEQIELPQYINGRLLLTLSGGAPIINSRNIITIHDAAAMAAPEGYSIAYRLWWQNHCRRMAKTAERILTVSNFSKSEIEKWYGAPQEKISVTYLGSDHFHNLEADASTLTRFGISGNYILAVGSHNPNKNFARVVKAFEYLNKDNIEIVIAGGVDGRVFNENVKLLEGAHMLGYVSDAELKALYQNAACFVFASLYEGFGLPPLEAASCGCPIVVSRSGSLPEIFDGVACFCDPYDPQNIATAIQCAIESPPATATELQAFARRFSWEQCASETLQLLIRN
jgi:glycosyltransferase involved in cell wall biosynthesis